MFRVPHRFQDARLKTIDPEQMPFILKYATALSDNVTNGRGLLLFGPPGVGKTWAMVALTHEYQRLWARPDYEVITSPELFDRLNDADFDKDFDDYRGTSWIDTFHRLPWLVINDLGKESWAGKRKAQASTHLGRLIRARNEHGKVTHITTNLRGPEIKEVYGETVMSLIGEMMTAYEVLGPDRRRVRPK